MIEIRKHLTQYVLLVLTLVLIVFALKFIYDLFWRFVIVFSLASLYLGYGTMHHYEEKSLNKESLSEYIFIALVILLVLFSAFS